MNRCPDLGDIILQAFIARQQLLRESASFTGLCVIGSRYSHDTFRVRDFLARNRVWFTWLDLESNPQVNQLLKQFGVTEADTPVVACGHMLLLRNPRTACWPRPSAFASGWISRFTTWRGRWRARGTGGCGLWCL